MDRRLEKIDPLEEKLRRATPKEDEDRTVEEALLAHLDPLIEQHLIAEVLRPIKTGKEAVVYEKRDVPGGLCETVIDNGFRFDRTGHLLHLSDSKIKRIVYIYIFPRAGNLPAYMFTVTIFFLQQISFNYIDIAVIVTGDFRIA